MLNIFDKNGTQDFACRYHRGALFGFLMKTVYQKSTSIIPIKENTHCYLRNTLYIYF